MVTSDTLMEEQEACAQAAPLITDSLDEITDFSDLIRSDAFSQQLFSGALDQSLADLLHSDEEAEFEQRVQGRLEGSAVSSVRFYLDLSANDTDFSDLSESTVFAYVTSIRTTYWYGIFQSSRVSSLFCPPLYLSSNEKNAFGDCAYILSISIRRSSDTTIPCYMAVYFDSSSIQEILLAHRTQQGSVSYVTNERDAMVTTTDSSLSGIYYMGYDSIRTSLMNSNGFLQRDILGETVYVSYYYLPTADWFLVTITPSQPLREKSNRLLFMFFLVWLGTVTASIFLGILLSRSMTRRIMAVSSQMSRVKNELPVPMKSPAETDEIGDLVDSYNYMSRQINRLVDEQAKAAEDLRIAEFNSLQAQINPHFLYNTMEMINWMTQQGRVKETGQAIRDLSRFYKLTLNRKGSIGSLRDEIEHVTIYMRLQNMRFNDSVDFVVDVPDSLYEQQIPRLSLQPIIENALLHGIFEKPSKSGTIVLTGWEEDRDVVLLISDDGVGIPPEKLETLLVENASVSPNENGSHIAIFNTHRRFQILYGETYGLSYTSTVGEGTEVEVRFPARRDNAESEQQPGSSPDPD